MTSQFHRKIFGQDFDKLFDLKVVTAFYEGHFRHCAIKGIESIVIFPQNLHAKPIRIVMEMVTAMLDNANAWLIMSMRKIARIMDVSTYIQQNFVFIFTFK